MHRNFDKWNDLKKRIDGKSKGRFYHEKEIWWCNLGFNVGNEQNGSGANFQRPILIIRSLSNRTFFALPLTTSKENNKYRIDIGNVSGKSAKVILSQLKVIDTKRLTEFIEVLDDPLFIKIKKID